MIEAGLGDDGVVGASVERDDEFVSTDGEMAAGFDEFAVKLFGFHAFAALESVREPAVTPVGEHGQDDVGVDVQTHFAGEAIEVEEIDVDAEVVFDGVAGDVAGNDFFAGDVFVVGEEQRGGFAMEIRGDLPAGAGVFGRTLSPANQPKASSKFQSEIWLLRSLSNSLSASKLST